MAITGKLEMVVTGGCGDRAGDCKLAEGFLATERMLCDRFHECGKPDMIGCGRIANSANTGDFRAQEGAQKAAVGAKVGSLTREIE
jgi:hypothetical protein